MLDLNEITAACESLTCDKHRGWTEGEEFIARARTWLPALVAELREARQALEFEKSAHRGAVLIGNDIADTIRQELEQARAEIERPTITELRERNGRLVAVLHTDEAEIERLRAELRHVQAERDTLQALVPLYCAVDDYLHEPGTNDYPTGHCNPDRLEALRILFLGMSVDTEEANDAQP